MTNDEINTLCQAAFNGTFGKVTPCTMLVAKIIARYKDSIRSDIKEYICKRIEDCVAKDWKQDSGKTMDKVCWAYLLNELKGTKDECREPYR